MKPIKIIWIRVASVIENLCFHLTTDNEHREKMLLKKLQHLVKADLAKIQSSDKLTPFLA